MIPDWLKNLIKLEPFKNLRKAGNIGIINITLNRTNVNSIDVSKLTPEEREQFFSRMPKAVSEGSQILEAEYEETSENYRKELPKPTSKEGELLIFFEDKIPEEDMYALKAAIFIKKVFDQGNDVKPLKQSLRYKYGQRGVNISNLYSAGYFETWIRPLYERMTNKEAFVDAYNLIVEKAPFAVFVSTQMGVEQIKIQVREKIKESMKYGIKECNIHGIGEENVMNITRAVQALKEELDIDISFDQSKGAFFVAKLDLSKVKL